MPRFPLLIFALLPGLALAQISAAQTIEFNRDIRPIFSDRCYTCHGPSSTTRRSPLRFDTEEGAKQKLANHFAIAPGKPAESELLKRVTAGNSPLRMPPVSSGPALTDHETDLLRRWIEQGAVWEKHWSFIPPKSLAAPTVSEPSWVRNPIDAFILARLDKEGIKHSPAAPRETLLRRVTLDLTGLPPTPAELDAFLADNTPNAYEKVVDRLLASPRYGERMAMRWLDAARYADTNGYQTDAERYMWRWRDWVIEAFNRNMPYDRFTVEQLAGDLLPNPTLDQRIATGFNRNHRGNGEGGIVPEEYAVEYVIDRVDTTSTVFLGLTAGCARCHDHKYDPIAQKEYYQLYAFFNNLPERGNAQKYGNSPPFIAAPTPPQQTFLKDFDARIATAKANFDKLESAISAGLKAWKPVRGSQWFTARNMMNQWSADSTVFDGTHLRDLGNNANFSFQDPFTLSLRVNAANPDGALITRAKDEPEGAGYSLVLANGKLQANLVLRWLDDAIRVETTTDLSLNQWHHVALTWDGSRYASGVTIYVDGVPQPLKFNLDYMNQDFRQAKEPLRLGAGLGTRFRGQLDEVRIYRNALPASEIQLLAVSDTLDSLPVTSEKLRRAYLDQDAPTNIQVAWKTWLGLTEDRAKFAADLPTVMVMEELPVPRDAFLLQRGSYERPGQKVTRDVPAALPPLPADAPRNRLGFAKWLTDPKNPLPARVAVNRFWQMYFGTGIVKTVEDFGSQGEWPSHPELLDWLATEFIRTNWDVKALQKTIVMSATYRQIAKSTPEAVEKDPTNRLLSHVPRFRLPAEMVRDQALLAAGLLVEKLGGPSVKPYQPAGLWKELSGGEDYPQDHGESLYRRSMYTYWKRAAPPPMMANFDAAGREACMVRENRTNTPLQALDLMNDVTFVEAARRVAERMMQEAPPADRLAYGFRLVTSRRPTTAETGLLTNALRYNLDRFQTDPTAATKLLQQGESPRAPKLNSSELAAYATVASLILNLDEAVTRQ